MNEPRVAPDGSDPQRDAAYAAEGVARELHGDLDPIDVERLTAFASKAMAGAGWAGGNEPAFELDVPDDSGFSGWQEGSTGTIHLHPRLLDPFIVLHEVAHWLRPRDGHGAQWCGTFLGLVRAGIGADAAEDLRYAFEEFGLDVDEVWCAPDVIQEAQ